MHIGDKENRIINGLIEVERAIRDLYRFYAQKYIELASFWTTLAHEENEHANWLVMLRGQIEGGSVSFDAARLNLWAIEQTVQYVKDKSSATPTEEIDLRSALSTAFYLENAIMEKEFYAHYESDRPEIKKILHDLRTATEVHINRIKQMIDSIESQSRVQ